MNNKLFIIGNGFDLAHGFKTNYDDFTSWLVKESLRTGLTNFDKDSSYGIHSWDYMGILKFDILRNKKNLSDIINLPIKEIKQLIKSVNNDFSPKLNITNEFVRDIIFQNIDRWVDIENKYFEHLKKAYAKTTSNTVVNSENSAGIRSLLEINNGIDFLKKELEKYLTNNIDCNLNAITKNNYIERIINSEIISPVAAQITNSSQHSNFRVHCLNFNYTNTLSNYISTFFLNDYQNNLEINNIHGELNKPNNPIIFGYGDESDKHYKLLEELNDNRFLNHVKSFDYLKTNNYRKLLEFIRINPYDIYILGHSCGLSDRVLLKTIFEHENCKNIKVYYYKINNNQDDYFFKTQEISRHFDDKLKFRTRIVPYFDSEPMCVS